MSNRVLRAALLAACFLPAVSTVAQAATYQGNDLFPLALLNEFDGSIPTGFHPAAGGVVGGQLLHADNFAHAALWTGPGLVTDLNPPGYQNSYIHAVNAVNQVGYATTGSNGTQGHAFLWSNTRSSAIDLTPAGYFTATAYGLGTAQQVGSAAATPGGADHAATWNGSAETFIDIHPAGFAFSNAYATDDTFQVGSGSATTPLAEHALRWSNGAGPIDLHPTNLPFTHSTALTVQGQRTASYASATAGSNRHALLWPAAAAFAIDLTPAAAREALVFAVNDSIEVGTAEIAFATHAALWSGSADSFIDLHALLPTGFSISIADAIGLDGTIYGYAQDANFAYHAVSWTVIPEPAASATLGLPLATALLHRRRHRN